MTTKNDNDAVFTVAEVAARWKTTARKIRERIKSGDVRAFKVSERGLRVTLSEVLRHELGRDKAA